MAPPASAVENPVSATPVAAAVEHPTPVSATARASALENPSRPCRQVSKFEDLYGMVLPYCGTFEFEFNPDFDYMDECDTEDEEDTNQVANPRETLIKYVAQIRKSFGFDVDCIAPSWFNSAGAFIPVDLSEAKLNDKKTYDNLFEASHSAITDINSEMSGKSYELVEMEKVVWAFPFKKLLTLRVKEVDAIKTIQAIVQEERDDSWTLLQWRFKPVEEDAWYQPPPLHVRFPWLKPADA